MDEEIVEPKDRELPSRRAVLRGSAIAGGTALIWTAPAVRSVSAIAAPPGSGGSGTGTGTISGQVTDATTADPIVGATVTLDGGATTTTDGSGNYSFLLVPTGTHSVGASATGYSSQTDNGVVVTAGNTTTENFALVPTGTDRLTIVMSWGNAPSDLDLHMSGPDGNGGRFHCAWYDQHPTDFVSQDVDDVDGNGPETDTIGISPSHGNTWVAGDYHVWVHNYAHGNYPGEQNFSGSGAKIVVNGQSGPVATYLVSNATGDPNDDLWHVAHFTVDGSGNLTINLEPMDFEPGNTFTEL